MHFKNNSVKNISSIDSLRFYINIDSSTHTYILEYIREFREFKNKKFDIDNNIKIEFLTLNKDYKNGMVGYWVKFYYSNIPLFRLLVKFQTLKKQDKQLYVRVESTSTYYFKSIYLVIAKIAKILKNLNIYLNNCNTILSAVDLNLFVNKNILKEIDLNKLHCGKLKIQKFKNTETIYIGETTTKTKRFRFYRKDLELIHLEDTNSLKFKVMNKYFKDNKININEPLVNLEVNLKMQYLKRKNINSLSDLFKNIDTIFKESFESVIMFNAPKKEIEKAKKNRHLNKLESTKWWEDVKSSYNFKHKKEVAIKRVKVHRNKRVILISKMIK